MLNKESHNLKVTLYYYKTDCNSFLEKSYKECTMSGVNLMLHQCEHTNPINELLSPLDFYQQTH